MRHKNQRVGTKERTIICVTLGAHETRNGRAAHTHTCTYTPKKKNALEFWATSRCAHTYVYIFVFVVIVIVLYTLVYQPENVAAFAGVDAVVVVPFEAPADADDGTTVVVAIVAAVGVVNRTRRHWHPRNSRRLAGVRHRCCRRCRSRGVRVC